MKNSPNADGFFEADSAQQSVDVMNANKDRYVAKRDEYQAKQDHWQGKVNAFCPWIPMACLRAINQRNEAKKIKEADARGVSWWLGANDEFRLLMGDISMANNPQASCECINYNSTTGTYTGPFQTMGNNGNCTSTYSSPYQFCNWVAGQSLTDVDSDGIVLASSAIALPGASKSVLLDGDSRFQLVNSPRLKIALNGLWGNGHGEDFFITPTK